MVYPVHPRAAKNLTELAALLQIFNLLIPNPIWNSIFWFKFKGCDNRFRGITEEATVMGIPCMTLRNSTERPETISLGTNELVGIVPDNLLPYLNTLLKGSGKGKSTPLCGMVMQGKECWPFGRDSILLKRLILYWNTIVFLSLFRFMGVFGFILPVLRIFPFLRWSCVNLVQNGLTNQLRGAG